MKKLLSIAATLIVTNLLFAVTPLPNPGFEEGNHAWRLDNTVTHVDKDAAYAGKQGLRIKIDKPQSRGSSAYSSRMPVEPGSDITLAFWARAEKTMGGVYLYFFDDGGNVIKTAGKETGGLTHIPIPGTDGNWQQQKLHTIVPEKAAAIALWIHAYSSASGVIDLDDFSLKGLPEDAKPIKIEKTSAASHTDTRPVIPRSEPALIVIKLDDLKQKHKLPHERWMRVADYLASKGVKASMGMLCETLQDAQPTYIEWIHKYHDSGQIEFWLHGWDHAVHKVDGVKYNEFRGRSTEELSTRITRCQNLARERLGFAFKTFGPPGGVGNGSLDSSTLAAIHDDPDLAIILYPQPMDSKGRDLEAKGKVTILDRVWKVNLEGAVGRPDLERFVNGYHAYNKRKYFVLQGHPAMWTDERFAEFEKIIDFLIAEKAVFVTPTECVELLKERAD